VTSSCRLDLAATPWGHPVGTPTRTTSSTTATQSTSAISATGFPSWASPASEHPSGPPV